MVMILHLLGFGWDAPAFSDCGFWEGCKLSLRSISEPGLSTEAAAPLLRSREASPQVPPKTAGSGGSQLIRPLLGAKWTSGGLFTIDSTALCDLEVHSMVLVESRTFFWLSSADLDKIISTP